MTRRYKLLLAFPISVVLTSTLLHFPWRSGPHPEIPTASVTAEFYDDAYTGEDYAEIAPAHAETAANLGRFVAQYGLSDARVLEVGSGRGALQDIVENYTGSDIATTARHYYHKPFVVASATDLPFPDSSFDAVWTIWVVEHVPHPELALREIRRVTKSGGLIYLKPAWNTPSWLAAGYEVRPYSAFGSWGKAIKATAGIRRSTPFKATYLLPIRFLRGLYGLTGETTLRYRAITPNYDIYWQEDTDAINSIDCYEAMLWHETRGDECLNCSNWTEQIFKRCGPLIIRVHK